MLGNVGARWVDWHERRADSQIDCGFRIQGNTGRRPDKTPKHSFRLVFRKTWPRKTRFPVFPDSPGGSLRHPGIAG